MIIKFLLRSLLILILVGVVVAVFYFFVPDLSNNIPTEAIKI